MLLRTHYSFVAYVRCTASMQIQVLAYPSLTVGTERWFAQHSCERNNNCVNPPCPQKKRNTIKVFLGGQGWIRTTEVADGRFTVCSLWPLGNLPIFFGAGDRNRTNNLLITNQLLCLLSYTSKSWCLGADSNHRHRDFQSLALPTEL